MTEQRVLTESSITNDAVGSFSSGPWVSQQANGTTYSSDPYLSPTNSYSISPASIHLSPTSHAIPVTDNSVATQTGLVNFDEHEACLMRYFVVQLGHWVSDNAEHLVAMF